MLVLSRKKGQAIKIGDEITVVVKGIQGNRVSIGIVAPREIHVVRTELDIQLSDGDNPEKSQ